MKKWYGDISLISQKELQQFKQDLEILEIIIYKAVNIENFQEIMRDYDNDEGLDIYNLFKFGYSNRLTMEEFTKIKNWLEEDK